VSYFSVKTGFGGGNLECRYHRAQRKYIRVQPGPGGSNATDPTIGQGNFIATLKAVAG